MWYINGNYLYINLLEMNFWGAVAFTAGNVLITIITYVLIYKGKISTVGGIIGIVLQLMSSAGTYMGKYVQSEPENYFAHGLATGCLVNALFVLSVILLISISPSKAHLSSSKEHILKNSSNETHFDFSNITPKNQNKNPRFKHIKLANGEEIRAIGKLCYCDLSVSSIFLTLTYYLISTIAFVYSGPLYEPPSETGRRVAKLGQPATDYIWWMEYSKYDTTVIFVGIIITLFLTLVPIIIILFRREKQLETEVVLSDHNLYIYKSISEETITLPLKTIETIDIDRNELSIVLHDTFSTSVRGISNANEIATEIANILQEQSSK